MSTPGLGSSDSNVPCPDSADKIDLAGQHIKRKIGETSDGPFVIVNSTQISDRFDLPGGDPKRMRYDECSSLAPLGYHFKKEELIRNGSHPIREAGQQGLPKLGPYHPNFKRAEAVVTKACDNFINAYVSEKELGYYNEEIENICGTNGSGDSGLTNCRIPSNFYPLVRPAVVLGPAGSGKSSALNSLMNLQKAAFAHDGTDRGTYVLHEYRYAKSMQTSRFLTEVPFLSREEARKAVKKHFQNICSHLPTTRECDDDIERDETPTEESYDTAIVFFCDLFADHDEFQTEQDAANFFTDMKPGSEEEIRDVLLSYVDEFLASRTRMVNNTEIYNADTEESLDAATRALARPAKRRNPGRKPSAWPLIRKVIVYLKLDLLAEGVILADLPGANDQNEIVAASTRSYLKQAGTILIFLPYRRVSKNSSLDQHLRESIHLGKMRDTHLILTMMDEMKAFDPSARADLSTVDQARVCKAEELVSELECGIRETVLAKDEIARAKESADVSGYMQLDKRLRSFEEQLKRAKDELKLLMIEIQCEDIRNELKGRFRTITGSKNDPDLPIHFVSNIFYQQYVSESGAKGNLNCLVDYSGIPQLRHDILKIPTLGKLDKIYGLCKIRLPNTFCGVNGVLTKSLLERKAEVKSVLMQQLNILCLPVDETINEIQCAFETEVAQEIKRTEDEWKGRAEKVLNAWEKLNTGTLLALFKRKGDWEHRKHGTLNCNLDIQDILKPELANAFNGFDDRMGGIQEDIKRNTQDTFDNIKRAVEDCPAAAGQILGSFMKYIDQIRQKANLQFDETFSKLEENLKTIRNCATIDAEDSYIRRVMCRVYQQCILITGNNYQTFTRGANSTDTTKKEPVTSRGRGRGKGTGRRRATNGATVHKARLQNIRNKFRGESSETSLFQDIGTFGREDLVRDLDTWKDGLRQIMETCRQEILEDFDRRFREPEVKAEDSHPESIQRLQDAARVSEQMIDNEAIPYLKECFAYEGRALPY